MSLTVDGVQVASRTITIGTIHHGSGKVFAIGDKPTSGSGADFYNGALKGVTVAFG